MIELDAEDMIRIFYDFIKLNVVLFFELVQGSFATGGVACTAWIRPPVEPA
jgi:hypothetical protein